MYIGGAMAQLSTAAFDPVYFLHHAFIDYLWELFRTRLRSLGEDPEIYPEVENPESRHQPTSPMGLGGMNQQDGYTDFLTGLFEYEAAPFCSVEFPQCGSRFLMCIVNTGRCT